MENLVIRGGKKLKGSIYVSGSKNVALKALVAACLTEEKVILENVPLISDIFVMTEIIKQLGGTAEVKDHTIVVQMKDFKHDKIFLEEAAEIRTSFMFIAPILARIGKAVIPNPGGCRIGARPIDRTIGGIRKLGATIAYNSEDGYFYAKLKNKELRGVRYEFSKNTHTGTETLLLASVLAKGKTVIENAAREPEVDELIGFLNQMGGKVKRTNPRTIEVEGVEKLHGATFKIGADRNEIVTFAVAAILTEGDVFIEEIKKEGIEEFLNVLKDMNGGFEVKDGGIRFYYKGPLVATSVTTSFYPGFMTDWQGPIAALMTKANGESVIHETVYENRLGYTKELNKMGAEIELFNPEVKNPDQFYNFNDTKENRSLFHAAKIKGPIGLHNAILDISDLRAGATLALAALAAKGESAIFGLEYLDRGYEGFETVLKSLGADIKRSNHE
jgi:UDP-N-acetylglucosamine 1-carboxyvinyltransferase